MAAKKNSLTLRITGPDGTTVESTSDLDSVIVGSGSDAAVRVTDPKVSTMHLMLKREQNGLVTAIDLGSEHGSLLGESKINAPVALASGDVIVVGNSKVKVLFDGTEKTEQVVFTQPASSDRAPRSNGVSGAQKRGRALGGTGPNAAMLFSEPLPAEVQPTDASKALQVALLWGDTLINVQQFPVGKTATIGAGKDVDFTVYGESLGKAFALASGAGNGITVNVPNGANVVVSRQGDQLRSRDQLKSEGKLTSAGDKETLALGLHDRAMVSLDSTAFIVRYVKPSNRVAAPMLQDGDYTYFKIASIALLAFFALVVAVVFTPKIDDASDDIFKNPSKYVKMIVKPEKKIEFKKKELSGAEEGKKAKDDEGKFGKKEEKKKEADPSKAGAPIVNKDKREEDRKKIASAGLLGALGKNDGAASNLFGPGGLGTGINNALGGLKGGAGVGDAQGVGGLGARGTGAGGGGTGLGLGGLGTKGSGRGAGGGGLDLGGRGKSTTRIIPGKTTVVGGLDKDVIAKIIRRHQNEIKYCYESELQKDQSLAGRVMVAWMIDPAGGVADANVTESTMGNATVEQCMLSKIRRWRFPEPKGGGVVNVTFPWVFKGAGE